MRNEGIPKASGPSPEELRQAKEAYEEADPTTYSTLPPKGELIPAGVLKYMRESDPMEITMATHEEDLFYELRDDPSFQQAVSRYLKGIVNVSDVVAVTGEKGLTYHSKHMPLEKVKEQETPDEIIADKELLQLIFGDLDRAVARGGKEALNMRVEDSKVAFYDFAGSTFYPRTQTWADDRIRHEIPKGGPERELSKESLARLRDKLSQLKERYLSEEGRVFAEQIYNSLKGQRYWPTEEISFNSFYSTLEKRITGSITYVDAVSAYQEYKKAA